KLMSTYILQKHGKDRATLFEALDEHQVRIIKKNVPLTDLPKINPNDILIVTLPGEDILATQVKLPKASRSSLKKAIPFALEEQLLTDIENLHFVLGDFDEQGTLQLLVVDKNYLEQEISSLEAAGITPNCILPDYLAIAWQPRQWSMVILDNKVLVRF